MRNKLKYDLIVVGSGFCGSTIAYLAAKKLNKKVLLLDRRSHIGGNMYDSIDENGILVHRYGPHILHTNNDRVYNFLVEIDDWMDFSLKCGAVIDGKYSPTPFNFTTIDIFYNKQDAQELKDRLINHYPSKKSATVVELFESKDALVRNYAEFLFQKDYRPYTSKQWGKQPEEIDVSVLKRVPVNLSYDDKYFADKYQILPVDGYTAFFLKMLNHPNITIELCTEAKDRISFNEETNQILFDEYTLDIPLVFTGAIDDLFDMRFGRLPYRSLVFDYQTKDTASYQQAPVVAHPQAKDFTRITEYTKLPVQDVGNKTTIAVEYSYDVEDRKGMEPYYPIPTTYSSKLYKKYKDLAEKYDFLFLCGRLADYKYYNMDNAIERAFEVFEKLIIEYL